MNKCIVGNRVMCLCLLILVILISGCSYHPPVAVSADDLKPIEFSEVVTAEGMTKDQLYSAALAWFGGAYHSAKTVFDMQDREAGRIVGKPLFQCKHSGITGTRSRVIYSVTIEVKDGRYRYIIGNFVHEGSETMIAFGLLTYSENYPHPMSAYPSFVQNTWPELQSCVKDEATLLIADLKKNMVQPAHKTDW